MKTKRDLEKLAKLVGAVLTEDTPIRDSRIFQMESPAGKQSAAMKKSNIKHQTSNIPLNPHARALGKLGKGIAKTITHAERKRRAERLARAREKRWEPKPEPQSPKK